MKDGHQKKPPQPPDFSGPPDTLVQPSVEASWPLAAEGLGALAAAFAGYRTTSLHCPKPYRIAFNQLRITVRPLREDDLPWLRPDQVDHFDARFLAFVAHL